MKQTEGIESKQLLQKFLTDILQQLEQLTPKDLEKLQSNQWHLTLKLKKNLSPAHDTDAKETFQPLISQLMQLSDREKGYQLLNQHCKTRKTLQDCAKAADIHVMANDNMQTLKEKIIEGTIGAQLRTKTLQESPL